MAVTTARLAIGIERVPVTPRVTSTRAVGWMVTLILLFGAIAYGDERNEASSALEDFAAEQARVARAAAITYGVALDERGSSSDQEALHEAAVRVRALEQPGFAIVLLSFPGMAGLRTLDGASLHSPSIEAGLAAGVSARPWVRLNHDESAALGLPSRTAIAGIASVDRPGASSFRLVVVSSALRERDREERGQWRVFIAFLLSSAIVVSFGVLTLRRQKKELVLAEQLAIAAAMRTRDERLVRADKLATLGALASGVAHQVATPLGVIVARASRLAPRVAEDDKARRAVDAIAEQAHRIGEIVRVFLSLARGGSPSLRHVDAATIARAAIDLVAHRFEEAGVGIALSVDDGAPSVACDPALFEQAIVNLLLNALEACAVGGAVTLAVRTSEQKVSFTVEDDGVGISEADAARATEPFFTTKAASHGTGLGLAIANEIVAFHAGSLVLEPRKPRGTRACIEVSAV